MLPAATVKVPFWIASPPEPEPSNESALVKVGVPFPKSRKFGVNTLNVPIVNVLFEKPIIPPLAGVSCAAIVMCPYVMPLAVVNVPA